MGLYVNSCSWDANFHVKARLHPRKGFLPVSWNTAGIVQFEVLEPGQIVTAELYCQQLEWSKFSPRNIYLWGIEMESYSVILIIGLMLRKWPSKKSYGLRLESFTLPTLFPWHCALRLSVVSIYGARQHMIFFFSTYSQPPTSYKKGIETLV